MAAQRDVADLKQWRTPTGESEHSLESECVIEVAANGQLAALERIDPGKVAPLESQPGVCVGGDCDVGPPAGRTLADPSGVARATDLPRAAEIAELEVVGRLETRIRSQIAVGK